MRKKGNEIFSYLVKVKDLELHTDEGKINYRWGLILVALIAMLTGSNWILKAIAFLVGTVKTFILKTNVIEEYEEANTMILIILTVIFFVLCIIVLALYDRNKKKTEKEIEKEIENPIEKI